MHRDSCTDGGLYQIDQYQNDQQYKCVEQYLAQKMALLFSDLAEKILIISETRDQKQMECSIPSFDSGKWREKNMSLRYLNQNLKINSNR